MPHGHVVYGHVGQSVTGQCLGDRLILGHGLVFGLFERITEDLYRGSGVSVYNPPLAVLDKEGLASAG